jgi:hypothetical protein
MFHESVFPIPMAQARITAAKLKALGIHHIDAEDVMQEAWLLQQAHPELGASGLIAIQINQAKQSRRRSIIASVELPPDYEPIDDSSDDAKIEKWRLASDDDLAAMGWSIDPVTLRSILMSNGNIGDRRARQLLQSTISKLDAGQCDLFTNQIGA